jgi:hypothetical protein
MSKYKYITAIKKHVGDNKFKIILLLNFPPVMALIYYYYTYIKNTPNAFDENRIVNDPVYKEIRKNSSSNEFEIRNSELYLTAKILVK